jgi:tRNA dimethylallyltransferase
VIVIAQGASSQTPLPRVAAILGSTASGKTAFAVRLAMAGLPIEAVCCDASQLVAGLDAATAKPLPHEHSALRHHLINAVGVADALSAGRYAAMALVAIEEIRARGRWPVLVGGTGLYHSALVRGLSPIPPSPDGLRAELEAEVVARGLPSLWDELATVDPIYAATTPVNNRQRVLRALEVFRATGQRFSAWHATAPAQPLVRSFDVVLSPCPLELRDALDRRAAAMVTPLLAEVRTLQAAGVHRSAPGLAALGYREAWDLLLAGDDRDAEALLRFATNLAAAHRRYAKRQRTWFRRDKTVLQLDPADVAAIALAEVALRRHFDSLD